MKEPPLSPCADLVRRGDPDRFLSALTAPEPVRERLFALYAFNLELARIPAVVSEPMLGLIRLQWWRETVAMIFEEDRVRSHEVVGPLAETIRAAALPRAPFDRLLDARARDAESDWPADRAALDAYLADTGGALLDLAARALSSEPGPTADAGYAFAAAAWLRAKPVLPKAHPRDAPEARALATDALAALARARAADAPKPARPAYRAGWTAEATLRAALAPDYEPAEGPLTPSPFRRRAGLLWRAATGRW
ncbi:MAG: phytoene synthase [Rhodobacteraceae bacterium]|nr:MAG: phytoene synthase [Paracoccaceae bacterium]